jgi:hypothetical protein
VSLSIIIISCCKSKKSNIEFEELSDNEVTQLEKDYSQGGFNLAISTGMTQKSWEKVFKEVLKSDVFKKNIYTGLSNQYELGDILFKNGRNLDVYSKLKKGGNFTSSEISQIITEPNIAPKATYNKNDSISVELLINLLSELKMLNTNSSDSLNVEFKGLIEKSSVIDITVNGHEIHELILSPFKSMLNSDPKKEQYKIDLLSGKRYLVKKVLSINGYTLTANFNRDLSLELSAKLQGTPPVEGLGKFNFDGQRTIKIETDEKFVAFVELLKSKQIR